MRACTSTSSRIVDDDKPVTCRRRKRPCSKLNGGCNCVVPEGAAFCAMREHQDLIPGNQHLEIPVLYLRWTHDNINRKMMSGHGYSKTQCYERAPAPLPQPRYPPLFSASRASRGQTSAVTRDAAFSCNFDIGDAVLRPLVLHLEAHVHGPLENRATHNKS